MKITVKLYATLRDLLPANAPLTGVETEVRENATPNEVMDLFRVPHEMAHLVLRNGVYLEPEQRDHAIIREGDVLAIWPPIAGG